MKPSRVSDKTVFVRAFMLSLTFLASVIAVLTMMSASSQALRLSMKRVIFEGKTRSQTILVINNTEEQEAYRIGWRDYRMTEEKTLVSVGKDEDVSDLKRAENLIRFAPRRIELPPGGTQQVRLSARIPKGTEPGEYRSHLYIVPEAKAPEFTAEQVERAKEQPVVKVSALTGFALPVFVRVGKMEIAGSLSNLDLTDTGQGLNLALTINRQGNRSLYGDLDFVCLDGGEYTAKQVLGIAIYPEVEKRHMNFNFPYPEEGGASRCSTMRVDYKAETDDPYYKGRVIASETVTLAR